MKKSFITLFGLAALAPVWAQDPNVMEASASARMAYQDRQALAVFPFTTACSALGLLPEGGKA